MFASLARLRHLGALLLLWAAGVGGWSACHDDATDATDPDGTGAEGDVSLCLQLTVVPPTTAVTRAETVPGTAEENEIQSLTVFLVDVDDRGLDLLEAPHRQVATTYINAASDAVWSEGLLTGYRLLTRFVTPAGRKHVYVGANLTTDQIDAFRNGNTPLVYDETAAPTLKSLMRHFMALTDDRFTYTGSRISMFAQALPADREDSLFDVHSSGDPQTVQLYETQTVQLEHTVTKVLLACQRSTTDGDDYIEIKDINETTRRKNNTDAAEAQRLREKYRGWVHYANVFYMLNITARAQRLLGDSVATFGKYVRRIGDYDFVAQNDTVYTMRYLSHSADELSFSAQNADEYPFVEGALRRRVALWSEGATADDPVYYTNRGTSVTRLAGLPTEGIYCLPNRFRFSCWDADAQEGEGEEWYDTDGTFQLDSVAQKIATYVVTAVRYIPRTLHCLVNGQDQECRFATMAAALDTLSPAAGIRARKSDGTWQEYPAGTYWTLVQNSQEVDYYTGAAMQHKVDQEGFESWSLARYRCYERGYSYYICFIDPARCEDPEATFYQRNSYDYDVQAHGVARRKRIFGLERNHYYLLRADEISVPGSSTLSGPMCLNAVLVDWQSKGSQDVSVLPGEY
jgi:hypothetical protein